MNVYARSTLVIGEDASVISAADHLLVLEDPDQQFTIEQVLKPAIGSQFSVPDAKHPYYGYTSSALWYRLDLRLEDMDSWYLIINYTVLRHIDVYIRDADGRAVDGEAEIIRQKYRTPLYQLRIPRNKDFAIFIRIAAGKSQVYTPFKVMSSAAMLEHTQWQNLFYASIFAGMSVLALYHLFLFSNLRSGSYLGMMVFIIALQGMLYKENNVFATPLFLTDPESYFFCAPALIAVASGFYFWRQLHLQSELDNKFLLTISYWIPVVVLIFLPFCGLLFNNHSLPALLMVYVTPVLIIVRVKQAFRKQDFPLRNFAAFITFLLCIQPHAYNHTGYYLTDQVFSNYLINAGTLITIILLSITHAETTRYLREQKERIEFIASTKDEFLTTMSHELRTPMGVILGSNALLQKSHLSPQQKDYLNKQNTAAKHMMELVNQVLDLASIEQQKVTLEMETFSFHAVLSQLDDLLADQAQQKGITLSLMTDVNKDLWLEGDVTRLSQVLLNLLGNSIKFTDEGFTKLEINLLRRSGKYATVEFIVSDSGPGLHPEQAGILFQPYTQLDNSTSRVQGGTGLGLAISYKLVKMMGGELRIEEQSEPGSCFSFVLSFPVIIDQKGWERKDRLELSVEPQRILLVDDDELGRFINTELLRDLNFNVVSVATGMAAIELLKTESFDLVLMDISMPKMDGYETVQLIREFIPIEQLPIIALTAHAINGERKRCIEAGMNDYLAKPFETATLNSMIDRWVRQAKQPVSHYAGNLPDLS